MADDDTALDREMGYTDWRTSCRSPHPEIGDVVCRRAPHDGDHASGFGTGRVRWPNNDAPRPEHPVLPVAHTPPTEFTSCPDCGSPAEVVDRYDLDSTSGPIAHVATACVADRSHHYVQAL